MTVGRRYKSWRGWLGGLGPIDDRALLTGLKCQLHVGFAIGLAVGLAVAAEVEIRRHRIAIRPTAVVRIKRFDGLPLGLGDGRHGFDAHGRGKALICLHG